MMIPGRSCSAEGVARRVAVGPSRSEIAPLHFSVAIAGSASAGIAAYHRTRIADAIVIAAAARQLESQLTTTFAAHALGRGPARRYAIYGSAARGGGSAILALVDMPVRMGRPADRDAGRIVPASPVVGQRLAHGERRADGPPRDAGGARGPRRLRGERLSRRRDLCGNQPVRRVTRPCRLRRAVRKRHRHAIEQASRRWRGGRRTRRKILVSTQVATIDDYAEDVTSGTAMHIKEGSASCSCTPPWNGVGQQPGPCPNVYAIDMSYVTGWANMAILR